MPSQGPAPAAEHVAAPAGGPGLLLWWHRASDPAGHHHLHPISQLTLAGSEPGTLAESGAGIPSNSLLQAAFKGGLLLMRLVGLGRVLVTGPGHDETQHGVPGKHDLHQEHKWLFGIPAGGSRKLVSMVSRLPCRFCQGPK